MSESDTNSPLNGTTPEPEERPKSLREIAEESWTEVEAEAGQVEGSDEGIEPASGQDDRPRDSSGRFIAKPGEADTRVPAPQKDISAPQPDGQHPAPVPGSSSEAPQHWSPEDRAMFSKQTPEARDFLLRRHGEMERFAQDRVQQSATAVQFTQALAPIFEEPRMKASLANVEGRPLHPVHAVEQWAQFHLRAMDPNIQVRAGLVLDLAQRCGFRLDPAALGGANSPPPGLTEQDLADPAIKYFADTVGRTMQELNALRGELNTFKTAESQRANEAALSVTRSQIDAFADATDPQGRKLYPHFDAVLPEMIELYRANPNRDLKETYDKAVRMNDTTFRGLLDAQRSSVDRRQQDQRALQASRSNVRGRTAPVSTPSQATEPKGLRATIAAAAEEVGFEG